MSTPSGVSDAANHNCLVQGLIYLEEALLWMTRQLADPDVRNSVYQDLALKPPGDGAQFPDMSGHFDSVDSYVGSQSVDAEVMKSALEELRNVREAVEDFVNINKQNAEIDIFDALFRVLTMNFMRLRHPLAYWVAQPLLLLDDTLSSGVLPTPSKAQDIAGLKAAGRNILRFFEDPPSYIGSLSLPPLQTEDDAKLYSDLIFLPLAAALGYKGMVLQKEKLVPRDSIEVLYGWEPDPASQTPVVDKLSERFLSFSFATTEPNSPDHIQGSISGTFAIIPRDHGGPGCMMSIGGSAAVATVVDQWKLKATISSASAFSVLIKSDTTFSGPADAGFEFSLEHVPTPSDLPQVIDIGAARLEFGDFKITIGFSSAGFAFRAVAEKSAFVVNSDSHAVLSRASNGGSEEFRVQIGAGIAYSAGHFSIDGGSGFLVTFPVAMTLGPLQFRGVTIGLTPSSAPDQPYLDLEVSATIVLTLGCVALTVERIGLGASLSDDNGFDLGFKDPKGIGIAVKSPGISGGGYLFFDHTSSTYAGVFDLSITDLFTVKAVGLLTTKLNDEKLFSLLLIVSVTGLEIALPFGFVLTGLGGLVGIDREVNLTALEAGVKAHTLNNVLFPPDPIANGACDRERGRRGFPAEQGTVPGGRDGASVLGRLPVDSYRGRGDRATARLLEMGGAGQALRAFSPYREKSPSEGPGRSGRRLRRHGQAGVRLPDAERHAIGDPDTQRRGRDASGMGFERHISHLPRRVQYALSADGSGRFSDARAAEAVVKEQPCDAHRCDVLLRPDVALHANRRIDRSGSEGRHVQCTGDPQRRRAV